ncbi:MAG: porin family protein [Siphonobacter sp.]
MKKVAYWLLVLTATSTSVSAQDNLSWGPTIGPDFSKFRGSNNPSKAGLTAGLFLNYSIVDHFGIGAQLLYTQLGEKVEDSNVETRLNYLQIPVLATFYLNNRGAAFRPKLFVGPHLGFLLAARNQNGDNLNATTKEYNSVDAGLTFGAGFNYRLSDRTWLNADVRYGLGLVDVTTSNASEPTNGSWGINVGVSFPLGHYQPGSGKFTPSRKRY